MAPKRNNFRSRPPPNKRKKLNLITLRQKNDYKSLGELHPADTADTIKSYTKIEDGPEKEDDNVSSSSDSDEEVPVLKQLLDVIGVKEEEPESEQEEDSSEEEEEGISDGVLDHTDDNSADSEASEEEEGNSDLVLDHIDDNSAESEASEEEEDEDKKASLNGSVNSKGEDDTKALNLRSRKNFFLDDEAVEDNHDENDEDELVEDDEDKDLQLSNFIDDEAMTDDSNVESDEDVLETDDDSHSEFSGEDLVQTQQGQKPRSKTMKQSILDKSKQNDKGCAGKDDDLKLKESDPFSKHFEIEEIDLPGDALRWERKEMKVPGIGKGLLMIKYPHHLAEINVESELRRMHVKQKLCDTLADVNKQTTGHASRTNGGLSAFQHKLFCTLNSYQDVLYPKQEFSNMEEIRLVYCLHALNHVLKTRSRIIAHNTKIQSKSQDALDDIEYRDQGLTRPKVLIMLPYRDRALKVFQMLIRFLSAEHGIKVSSRKRFEAEFSEREKREVAGKKYKSQDFIKMFEGNVDDNFRVGMSISRKSLRLYSPFYESDIILASPLGLRTVIGNEGDPDRDFDFLSSIEILIMDQADVFLMQNWDHVCHIFKHLHLQPKEAHGTDFSRVRMWAIDGLSKHFRQTLIFSQALSPEIMTVFNKQCHNYSGKLLIQRDVKNGTIGSCLSDCAQIFHCVPCDKPDGISQRNAKFDFMKRKIIPHHTSRGMTQTLIYCNYFSFVLLRNYFREADIDFLFINEYDSESNISKTRIKFRKQSPHFMLYTERLHFHHRFRLKGIHHMVWFDVPQYPNFYPEIVNLMEVTEQACTSTCLFTKFDAQKLMEIVGQKRAAHIINSEKSVHMITVS